MNFSIQHKKKLSLKNNNRCFIYRYLKNMHFLFPFLLLSSILPSSPQFVSQINITTMAKTSEISSDGSLLFIASSGNMRIFSISGSTSNLENQYSFSSTIKSIYIASSDIPFLMGFTDHVCHYHIVSNGLTLQSNITSSSTISTAKIT